MDYKQTYYKRQDVEEFKKTVNQSAINNINEFMTNPISQMINIINENNLTISQYLAQNNVQSLAKALKLTNLDTLKVNFTSDINENASYNPLTNEITLNTRNEGNYIPIIAHEMVGHAILGEVIQSDSGNAIYENIAKNILSEQELANIRNNYTELDESGFKEEVVSFGLQKIMNNTNNLSYKKFIRKFFPTSFKDKIMNSLDTIFRNNSDNRVLNEIRKTIRQVLDENIAIANNIEAEIKYAKDIENKRDESSNNEEFEKKWRRFANDKRNITADVNDDNLIEKLEIVKNANSKEQLMGVLAIRNFDYKSINKNVFNEADFNKPLVINKQHLYTILNENNRINADIDYDHYHNISSETFASFLKNEFDPKYILKYKNENKLIYLFENFENDKVLTGVINYDKKSSNNILTLFYKDFSNPYSGSNYAEKYDLMYKKAAHSGALSPVISAFDEINIIENNSGVNTEDSTRVKEENIKHSKSNILELSKNEVKDLANRKQGEVISYKSASDFVNSFNSIGEVLENRLGIKLNRNDTAVNDLFNDTNI